MSTLELDRLEEDVALARERVAADVARLRSPSALAGFKEDISDTLTATAQRTAADLKSRAAANPAAVLAIAAGLLWRFARHPPIASVLIGVGLTSLLRTNPASPPSPMVTRTGEFLESAHQKASELAEQSRALAAQARETAAAAAATMAETTARLSEQRARLSEQAGDAAARMSDQAAETVARLSEQAAQTAARVREQAAQVANEAARSAERVAAAGARMIPQVGARDAALVGLAALLVGAAALVAYKRTES
jgi:hypothetical protein